MSSSTRAGTSNEHRPVSVYRSGRAVPRTSVVYCLRGKSQEGAAWYLVYFGEEDSRSELYFTLLVYMLKLTRNEICKLADSAALGRQLIYAGVRALELTDARQEEVTIVSNSDYLKACMEAHFDLEHDRRLVDASGHRLLNADILRYFFMLARRRERIVCTLEPRSVVDRLAWKLQLAAEADEDNHSIAYERPWEALCAGFDDPAAERLRSPQNVLVK
ncbi:hypothetical protein FRC07_015108, partial [Ceratobasidium sp. 392]